MADYGSAFITRPRTWTQLKALVSVISQLQWEEDSSIYTIFLVQEPSIFETTIFKGTVPDGVIVGGYTQVQNDLDKADFETNYKSISNKPIFKTGDFNDPRILFKFGVVLSTSVTEKLVSIRPYVEPAIENRRSIVSSSTDDSSAGIGTQQVKLTYLTNDYIVKAETITMNGTTAVNTVATDVRFIEKIEVVRGSNAVGAITFKAGLDGGGATLCSIAANEDDTGMCHHYVPAGKTARVMRWTASVDDDVRFKLMGQIRFNGNLVNKIFDRESMTGVTYDTREFFSRDTRGITLGEKTYLRILATPAQATSTFIRSSFDLFEDMV